VRAPADERVEQPEPATANDAASAPITVRHRVQHLLLRALVGFLELLPLKLALAFASGCGTLLRWILRDRAQLVREQMAAALGRDAESDEVKADARACFRHFLRVPVQFLKLPAILKKKTPQQVLVFEDRRVVDDAVAAKRPMIFVTAHLGNWEIMGGLAPKLGVPIASVGRPVENVLLEREIRRLRERYGQRMIDKGGAGLPLARVLKQGGAVALLIDQNAGRRGVRVPFFHADASTFTLAAELARRFDALFIPVFTRVVGPTEVRGWFEPPIAPDPSLPPDEDAWRMTLLFHRKLEDAIRAAPGQYFWLHRRWKPGGREPDPAWREKYARTR